MKNILRTENPPNNDGKRISKAQDEVYMAHYEVFMPINDFQIFTDFVCYPSFTYRYVFVRGVIWGVDHKQPQSLRGGENWCAAIFILVTVIDSLSVRCCKIWVTNEVDFH